MTEADIWRELDDLLEKFDADARFEVGSGSMWSGEIRLTLTNPDNAPSRSMTFYSVGANDPAEAATALLADVAEWLTTSGVEPLGVPVWKDGSRTDECVWQEWNSLDENEPSPVKTIAKRLNISTGHVARIVYPPAQFDEWDDSQEPPLSD